MNKTQSNKVKIVNVLLWLKNVEVKRSEETKTKKEKEKENNEMRIVYLKYNAEYAIKLKFTIFSLDLIRFFNKIRISNLIIFFFFIQVQLYLKLNIHFNFCFYFLQTSNDDIILICLRHFFSLKKKKIWRNKTILPSINCLHQNE